jgi:hypothetical protein
METACGFKLADDSTFQFFFSYGALDRFGEGRWSVQGSNVVFNSKPKPATDFTLVTSGTGSADKVVIRLKDAAEMLARYTRCKISGGGQEQEGVMDQNGFVQFKAQPVETIELVFEFCPEKKSLFTVAANNHRLFEFKAEPWLMEVFFQNFRLALDEDGLKGGHPLSDGKSFRYEKSK